MKDDYNQWQGIDTSGLNEETFGVSGKGHNRKTFDFSSGGNPETSFDFLGCQQEEKKVDLFNQKDSRQSVDAGKNNGDGLATIAMIIGIVSLFTCGCSTMLGIFGIVVSVVVLKHCGRNSKAMVGLVCSVAAIVFGVAFSSLFTFLASQDDWDSSFDDNQETYESKYASEDDDTQETKVQSNEGSKEILDKEVSKIIIDGQSFAIPCKLENLMEVFEISEHDKFLVQDGLGANDSSVLYMAKNGEECGVNVMIHNPTEKKMSDIEKAKVLNIEVDGHAGVTATTINGISMGMTETEVDNLVKDITYNKSEVENFTFYNVYPNTKDNYYVTLMLVDKIVTNIGVYYIGE